jgi:hypothetical protein
MGDLKDWQAPLYALVTKKNVSDDVKDLVHIILRSLGDNTDPEFFFEHMKDPEALLERESVRIFTMAENNPDAITEFLDAFLEIDRDEALDIFQSIQKSVSAKSLSYFLVPYLLTMPEAVELRIWCLQMLGESSSPMAGWAIHQRYMAYGPSDSVTKKELDVAKSALKKLQLSGAFHPKQTNEITLYHHLSSEWQLAIEKQEAYCTTFTSHGDQACILVTHWRNGDACLMFVILNESKGIEESLVYNHLTQAELKRWFIRFDDSETRYPISPSYFKQKMQGAETRNFETQHPFPHEYTIWKTLLGTIAPAPRIEPLADVRHLAKPAYQNKTACLLKEPMGKLSLLSSENSPALEKLYKQLLKSWKKVYTASVKRIDDKNQFATQDQVFFNEEDFPELLHFLLEIDAWCEQVHHVLKTGGYIPFLQARLAEYLYLTSTPKQRKIPALMATEILQLEDSLTPKRFFLQYLRKIAVETIEESVHEKSNESNPVFLIFTLLLSTAWDEAPEVLQAKIESLNK